MAFNVFKKELKDAKKPLIAWSAGISIFMIAGMSKYTGLSGGENDITELIDSLPGGIGKLYGGSGANPIDLGSFIGFYAIITLYIGVVLAIHAVITGSRIISKEETDNTVEFLLVKPIARSKVLLAKLCSGFVQLVLLNIVFLITSLISLLMFSDDVVEIGDLLVQIPGVFAIQLVFFALAFVIAASLTRPKLTTKIAAGIMLSTFVLASFIDITEKFTWLKNFTPFKYFDTKQIANSGSYEGIYLVVTAILIVTMLSISFVTYKRRDMSV